MHWGDAPTLITALAALLTASGISVKALTEARKTHETIRAAVQPNGGRSLRDSVDRIEQQLSELRDDHRRSLAQHDRHEDRFRDLYHALNYHHGNGAT